MISQNNIETEKYVNSLCRVRDAINENVQCIIGVLLTIRRNLFFLLLFHSTPCPVGKLATLTKPNVIALYIVQVFVYKL